jgi:DNA replication protein DnaC
MGQANPSCKSRIPRSLETSRQRGLRVALIDRLTHHAEIISIDADSYRKREAEQAQRRKQEQKPKR